MEEAYYLLGYVAGDGCLCVQGTRRYVDIASTDIPHLVLIKEAATRLGWLSSPLRLAKAQKEGWKDLARFQLRGEAVRWLEEKGLTVNKSHLGCDFEVAGYERSFFRGLFDADGHLTVIRKGERDYPQVGITAGNRRLLVGVQKMLEQQGFILSITGDRSYKLRCTGSKAASLLRWMYERSTIHLARKRLKARPWLESK